ncbi:MAG: hypothetical protein ACI8ZB_001923 [Desulforhopalus sp.]|jgi:hypothetical protein
MRIPARIQIEKSSQKALCGWFMTPVVCMKVLYRYGRHRSGIRKLKNMIDPSFTGGMASRKGQT